MLDANIKTQLKAYLERVTQPIEIVASLDDGPKSREMKELLDDVAAQAVGIAEAGLVRRDRRNAQGKDETIHLAPLEETIRLAKAAMRGELDEVPSEA